MAMRLYLKNELKGYIENKEIIFLEDIGLNKLMNEQLIGILQEEDEYGNVIFLERQPSLNEKLIFLKGLGFDIKHEKSLTIEKEVEFIEEAEAKDYADFLRKEFRIWEKEVIKAVEPTLSEDLEKALVLEKTFGEFMRRLFNAVNTIGFREGLHRIIKRNIREGISDAEADLNIDIGFTPKFENKTEVLVNRQLEGFTIDGKRWNGIKGVAQDTRDKIIESVRQGIRERKGIDWVKEQIREVMDQDIGSETTDGRAMAIARTETTRIRSEIKLDAFKESGIEMQKKWVAHIDDSTCEICKSLNGEVRKLNEDFETKGKSYEHPSAHPNCRCKIVAVV